MYSDFADEELVTMSKNGDQSAFDELYSRYITPIRIYARAYFLVGGDEEDLCQEGLIGLFSAVNGYDKEKFGSSSFKTYANKCIKSRIINAITRARSEKHRALNDSVSIQEFVESEAEGFGYSPEDKIIGEEGLSELIGNIKSRLSRFELSVFELYVEGEKYTEIAEKLGKSPKSVDNAIQRIKEKTKELR